jgi:ribosomal subunit interface protein
MQSTLKITTKDFIRSEALKGEIREKVSKLERFFKDLIDCEVAIEAPVGHHKKGGPYNVRIDMQVKGKEIAVSNRSNTDFQVAIRDAFDAGRRQLEDYSRQIQRKTKTHGSTPVARVSRIFSENGYGFIQTPEGRELYFHRNSLLEPGI